MPVGPPPTTTTGASAGVASSTARSRVDSSKVAIPKACSSAPGTDVVPHELGERPLIVPEEREPRPPRLHQRTVQPERPSRPREHPTEHRLGVHGPGDPPRMQPIPDPPGAAGAGDDRDGRANEPCRVRPLPTLGMDARTR